MHARLLGRLRYLRNWELANGLLVVPGFVAILAASSVVVTPFAVASAAAVSLLLLVGGSFAHLKLQEVERGDRKLKALHPTLRVLRVAVPVALVGLLAIDPVGPDLGSTLLGVGFWLLAVGEYVNYFWIQLMYDNRADLHHLARHRRPKRGLIARELAR